VRIDPTARSTPEASSPTFSCCTAVARRIRPLSATDDGDRRADDDEDEQQQHGSMMNIATTRPRR
jgi:hypothetical protein